jgi:flagellar assembly factor FliW
MTSASPSLAVMITPHLGEISWEAESELFLPSGLPGFENERHMIPVEIPARRPLVFLQSTERSGVCFVSLPVMTIYPDFKLSLTEDERLSLLLPETGDPEIGVDVLCLALLFPSGRTVEANLDAPIVINLHNSRCLQAVSPEAGRGYYRLSDAGTWENVC